ncbi:MULTISPECIES: hypothetical protein [unclassified Pseudomonas]|uniref:hypothetical protein n=1 Tax=unclassified Pseudomonas TaxID=196821 RepID=UPI000AC791B6|nr:MULTISPECIES: hypothetical protein [unclassified Pseudomonas]
MTGVTRIGTLLSWLGGRHGQMAAALLVLLAALVVRVGMGFEFPIPWNDETAFTSQAFEFSRTGSFFVYGLNAERIVMWMPPGYMLLLAGIFKVLGYSFDLARWVSTLLYLGSFCVALGILRSLRLDGWKAGIAVLLTLIAFLSPYTLAISNMARMEAFYTLIFLGSLWAMLRERPGLGLALVLLGATVHFNAVYMLPPYALLVAWKILRREDLLIRPLELLMLVLAAVALMAYGLFAVKHIGAFADDMRFQFAFKMGSPVMDGPGGWLKVGSLFVLALVQLVARRDLGKDVVLTFYGAGFLALSLNGHNMWYSFALIFAIWLVLLGLLQSIQDLHTQLWARGATAVLAVALLYPLGHYAWARTSLFEPMWPRAALLHRSFLAPREVEKIRVWVAALPPGTTVSFGYSGVEPFFFNEFAKSGARWSISGDSMIQVAPPRTNDYRVFCDSALFPPYLAVYDWDGYPRKSQDTGCSIIRQGK